MDTTVGHPALPFRFFDPDEERLVVERKLPHWSQTGTICFLTWRTEDSMPRPVIESWIRERDAWLIRHGINSRLADWKSRVAGLPGAAQREFHQGLTDRWEARLDECHGECVLRRPDLSGIVAGSLRHFDGDRYLLTDFAVMPNHVHMLAAFPGVGEMLKQCDSWKHFTACGINKALGRRGRFWQVEGFDHLVRSPEQFEYLRLYIADNPRRGRLRIDEFVHYSRPLNELLPTA